MHCILTQFPSHLCQDTAQCCKWTGKRRWRRKGRNWMNCHFCNQCTHNKMYIPNGRHDMWLSST